MPSNREAVSVAAAGAVAYDPFAVVRGTLGAVAIPRDPRGRQLDLEAAFDALRDIEGDLRDAELALTDLRYTLRCLADGVDY